MKRGGLAAAWLHELVGLGGFFGSDTTDVLLRNSNTGGFEVYDISNNLITNAAFLGTVGLNWQVMGFGNFGSRGENDMIGRCLSSRAPLTQRFEHQVPTRPYLLSTAGALLTHPLSCGST